MRCAANCIAPSPSTASVSGGGVKPAAQFVRLVQVAFGGKKKGVAGERLRQQAGRDLALLLEDDVEERAAVDGQRDGRAQLGLPARRSPRPASASNVTGGETTTVSRCCMGLPQLLGGNFDHVGAAHAQVEPLVADRAMDANLDRIEEGRPCQQFSLAASVSTPFDEAGELKRPGADAAGGRCAVLL